MSILCVTPNPALDRTLQVPDFAAGGVWRADAVAGSAGGKGVNVARTLLRLGLPALCAGPLGGLAGRMLAAAADAEGIAGRWTEIDGETRTCSIIVGSGGVTTVINEPGPVLGAAAWRRLCADVDAAACGTTAVCISGSLPPDDPGDPGEAGDAKPGRIAALIAAASGDAARPVWVDASGAALADAVAAWPAAAGIKINADEAAELLGGTVSSPADALAAARAIARRGPARVVVTLGAAGAVLADGAGDTDPAWYAAAPAVAACNPVGSGDCLLAGLLAALAEGSGPAEALRLAVACGAANAATAGIAAFATDDLPALLAATLLRPLTGARSLPTRPPGVPSSAGGRAAR